jgi:hypothetical protein
MNLAPHFSRERSDDRGLPKGGPFDADLGWLCRRHRRNLTVVVCGSIILLWRIESCAFRERSVNELLQLCPIVRWRHVVFVVRFGPNPPLPVPGIGGIGAMSSSKPLPAVSEEIIIPPDRKTQALEEQNRLLLQLLEQSRHAGRSPPDREVDERLARLERLEALLAELESDGETRGWFRRKQKRSKDAIPVVNVYNTPRAAAEPVKPPWGFLAVLLIVGALAVVWIGSDTTSDHTAAQYDNHTGLYRP